MLQPEEKLKFLERALYEGLSKTADNEVHVQGDWVQVVTPKVKTVFKNGIYKSVLSDEEAPKKIEATIQTYKKHGLPFRWIISPTSRPLGLDALLESSGFKLVDTTFGMIAEPKNIIAEVNPYVRVEPLSSVNLEAWLEVQAKAWKVPPPGIQYIREEMKRKLQNKNRRAVDFLAWIGNSPVGASSLVLFDRFAHLVGGAVNPESREQGIYKTMVAARMDYLIKKKIPFVTVHCLKDTSAPICQKMGFEKVCEFFSYYY